MKATMISSNSTRKTAELVIVHGEGSRKRSETRHCQRVEDTFVGYVLDQDKNILMNLQQEAHYVAAEIDGLNRYLDTKEKKASGHTVNLWFPYQLGSDISTQYEAHVSHERTRASARLRELNADAEPLRLMAEIRRKQEQDTHISVAEKLQDAARLALIMGKQLLTN